MKQFHRFACASLLGLAALQAAPLQAAQNVCVETSIGNFCIELFDDVAPQTVANFMNYVNGGDYNGTFMHRSVPGFIVQAGGYFFSPFSGAVAIPKDAAVPNEYNRSNLRGTLAMAKLSNDPNSATNEWFINLADNSANLDNQNGGFTVFGKVLGNGMNVVDNIAARPVVNLSFTLGAPFSEVPLLRNDGQLSFDDFVTIFRMCEADADKLQRQSCSPPATGVFNGNSFTVPVLYRGVLYRVIFDLISTPPVYSFRVRTTQITLAKDIGQDRAVYDEVTLKIPTIAYGTQLIRNLVFDVTDPRTLEFKLVSYQVD